MLLETVERRDIALVAQGGKPGNADIDADSRSRRGHSLLDFTLRLNRHEPRAARLAHGGVAQFAENIPAVAVANPAQLGKKEAVVSLIELDLFRIRVAESIAAALALEAREIGAFGKKILVGFFQVLQGLLQRMTRRVL